MSDYNSDIEWLYSEDDSLEEGYPAPPPPQAVGGYPGHVGGYHVGGWYPPVPVQQPTVFIGAEASESESEAWDVVGDLWNDTFRSLYNNQAAQSKEELVTLLSDWAKATVERVGVLQASSGVNLASPALAATVMQALTALGIEFARWQKNPTPIMTINLMNELNTVNVFATAMETNLKAGTVNAVEQPLTGGWALIGRWASAVTSAPGAVIEGFKQHVKDVYGFGVQLGTAARNKLAKAGKAAKEAVDEALDRLQQHIDANVWTPIYTIAAIGLVGLGLLLFSPLGSGAGAALGAGGAALGLGAGTAIGRGGISNLL